MSRRRITQETFDDVVRENVEEFDMDPDEALREAVEQFESQGRYNNHHGWTLMLCCLYGLLRFNVMLTFTILN